MNIDRFSAEAFREALSYDPETGLMTWKVCKGGGAPRIGEIAGSLASNGYVVIRMHRRGFKAHRVAWLITHGKWPDFGIDHINGIKNDNRIANLRDVPIATNCQNAKQARANSKTGTLGVYHRGDGKFTASIYVEGRQRHLGSFLTIEDAQRSYVAAKQKMHAGYIA